MLELKVLDMSCGHCVQAITKAVKSVDSAAEVQADLVSKSVAIRSSARQAQIVEAVRSAGYESEPLTA